MDPFVPGFLLNIMPGGVNQMVDGSRSWLFFIAL